MKYRNAKGEECEKKVREFYIRDGVLSSEFLEINIFSLLKSTKYERLKSLLNPELYPPVEVAPAAAASRGPKN